MPAFRQPVQFENKWLSNIRQNVQCFCFSEAVLLCFVSNVFSVRKSLSTHAKISITSSYLKIIKCHLAVKCRLDSDVDVWNLTLIFQAGAEKTANHFRGGGYNFFYRTGMCRCGSRIVAQNGARKRSVQQRQQPLTALVRSTRSAISRAPLRSAPDDSLITNSYRLVCV